MLLFPYPPTNLPPPRIHTRTGSQFLSKFLQIYACAHMPINIKAVFIDTFSQWLTFFSSNDFLWCCFLFNGKFLRLLTSFEPGSERSSAPNPQSGRLTSPFYFNQFLVDKSTPFFFIFPSHLFYADLFFFLLPSQFCTSWSGTSADL